MSTYRYYDEFTSEEFDNFSYVFLVGALCLLAVATYAHVYAIFFTKERQNLLESVRKMNLDTLVYFLFNFVFAGAEGVAIIFLDADSSLQVCNAVYTIGVFVIYIGNFLLYRLLLSKSSLYDPMFRMRRLTTFTWYLVNVIYFPATVYGILATVIWDREFRIVEGRNHCVEYTTGITPYFFLGFDTIISICCMVILAAPPFLAPSDKNIRIVVARNCIAILIATSSTFLFFLYANTASGNTERRFFLISILIKVGSLDAVINFTCVLFSWPLQFYWRILTDNCNRAGMAITMITKGGSKPDSLGFSKESKGNSKGNTGSSARPYTPQAARGSMVRLSQAGRRSTRLIPSNAEKTDSLKLARETGVDFYAGSGSPRQLTKVVSKTRANGESVTRMSSKTRARMSEVTVEMIPESKRPISVRMVFPKASRDHSSTSAMREYKGIPTAAQGSSLHSIRNRDDKV
ncbi:hypothetical protein AAMO2058_000670500 [Amorphochlora amoebiformis]